MERWYFSSRILSCESCILKSKRLPTARLSYLPILISGLLLIGPSANAQEGSEHFRRALESRFAGQSDAAIAEYKRGLQLQPNNIDARMQLGSLLLEERGDLDGAISEFMTAIGIDPGCATCESRLNEAMEIKNGKPSDLVIKANLLYSSGQINRAAASYRIAIQADPTNAEAHNALAWTLYKLGGAKNLADGVKEVQEALKIKPDDAEYINTWACLLYDQGDIDGALSKWHKAIANSKKPSAADLYGLAIGSLSKGDKTNALKYFRDSIATDAKYADLNYVRDRVGMSVHTVAGHEQLASMVAKEDNK